MTMTVLKKWSALGDGVIGHPPLENRKVPIISEKFRFETTAMVDALLREGRKVLLIVTSSEKALFETILAVDHLVLTKPEARRGEARTETEAILVDQQRRLL